MLADQTELYEEISNPLDCVEDILAGQNWSFSRTNPDELMVDVSGRLGTYRMTLLWQEEYSAMQFFCHYDLVVTEDRRDLLALALARVNCGSAILIFRRVRAVPASAIPACSAARPAAPVPITCKILWISP